MTALAAIVGAANLAAARATVGQMLDRMPARATGHRVMVDAANAVVAAAGRAPVFGSKAGVAMLAGDLRLDNAPDLRRALSLPADTADANILIEAYERWGDRFADRLEGDFAFVLFDRARRRMLAVRDALGIRPLYYRAGVSHVRIASELAALVEPGDEPDEGFLAEMLALDTNDVAATPFLSVRRVPAGHVLVAGGADLTLTRYWEPSRELHRGSLAEHAERFRETFDRVVGARCTGLAQVGLHLSGGLDSSSVLGSVCANAFAPPVPGAMRFPWPEADEGEWIARAASRWNVTPVTADIEAGPAANDLQSARRHRDIPDHPTGAPLFLPLHRVMRDAGARVILTGFGGDQWWTGEMTHLSDLLRRGRVAAIRRWRDAGAAIGSETVWSWQAFVREGMLPLVPAAARRAVRHLQPAALPAWIAPEYAARVSLRDRLRRRPATHEAPTESWRRMRWRLESGEEAFVKERFDYLAIASDVELRHPFYDRRLVELAMRTPQEAMFDEGRNRGVMRLAMRDRLAPETHARVAKADLARVMTDALDAADVQPLLGVPRLAERGWVIPAEAGRLLAQSRGGDAEAAVLLWRVLAIEAWLHHGFRAS